MTVASVAIAGRAGPITIDDDLWREHRVVADAASVASPARLAYGAPHVAVHETIADTVAPEAVVDMIDWEVTAALRQHLADNGFGIAEAMDTAQRFEIGWPAAQRLIELTGGLEPAQGFAAGAGTDHVPEVRTMRDLVDGVVYQAGVIRDAGGIPVILPMRWLPENDASADDYVAVYADIAREHDGPLFVHWLGAMFAPFLEGYFPGDSFDRVMAVDPATIRGAKLSLLDAPREVAIRRQLLERDQIMLTGDDFNFAALIEGGDQTVTRRTHVGAHDVALGDFSHALLGIIDGIAAPAGLALRLLAIGEVERYRAIMTPCEGLARVVFENPTLHYKAGLAFLSWLSGRQPNPMLVNHAERLRTPEHLVRVVEAAVAAGAIADAVGAARRLEEWLAEYATT